ncbi:MAG: hypothetical protein MZV63_57665 [Marinilabiliales bacterium]|nr:hypothetical protein [Marinilabiliales bacterium]
MPTGIRERLDELPDVQPLTDGISGCLGVEHSAAKAVETGGIEGIIDILLDGELFVVLMERALLGGHEPGAHGGAIGAQGKGRGETLGRPRCRLLL